MNCLLNSFKNEKANTISLSINVCAHVNLDGPKANRQIKSTKAQNRIWKNGDDRKPERNPHNRERMCAWL